MSHYVIIVAGVELAQVRPVYASAVGYVIGATVKYWLNYTVAFRSSAPHLSAVVRFVLMLGVLFLLNGALFWILNEALHVHYLVAQIITTTALIFPGYLLSRDWVFRHAER